MNKNYDEHYFKLIESIAYLEYFINEEEQKIKYYANCDTEHSYYYISVYTKLIDKYKSELILQNYNKDIIDFDVVHFFEFQQLQKELEL